MISTNLDLTVAFFLLELRGFFNFAMNSNAALKKMLFKQLKIDSVIDTV